MTKRIGRLQLGFKKWNSWGEDWWDCDTPSGFVLLISLIGLGLLGVSAVVGIGFMVSALFGSSGLSTAAQQGFGMAGLIGLGIAILPWLITGIVRLCYLRVYVVKEGRK